MTRQRYKQVIYYYDTDTASSDYAIWCNPGYSGTRVGGGDVTGEFFVDNWIYVTRRDDRDFLQCL